jgi:FkbM family methyltransferase
MNLRILKRSILSKPYMLIRILISIPKEKKYRIINIRPIYKIIDNLNNKSVIVDLGTGREADFSQELIKRYRVTAIGFDPTLKHHQNLDSVVKQTNGAFRYYKYAISNKCGSKRFYESISNVSGSFHDSHLNIRPNCYKEYMVETITIHEIFNFLKIDHIDLLKIDIEGEEYCILDSLFNDLNKINQIVIEFHHNSVTAFKFEHTDAFIKKLETAGFTSHTIDNENYLFFRSFK